MAKKQTRNQGGLTTDNVDGNVDKIREILFGGQMRDYEQRFADLETRLTKNIELISSNFENVWIVWIRLRSVNSTNLPSR